MLIIRNGRVIDPKNEVDEIRDVYIVDGKIADAPADIGDAEVIDAAGCIVAPGLVDMHVHLRDPGQTYKEDIISGAEAAAAGGVTTVVCMPNTSPVIDGPMGVGYVAERAEDACVNVLPFAAVTVGQQGEELTDFAELREAGAVALSDDGNPIMNAAVMRRALQEAKRLGLLISTHSEDADMVKNYAVNEGEVSRTLGINGRPSIAEEIMIARDTMLAQETGARVHVAHVSSAGSVNIIRGAKAQGIQITAETCPQYFTLTESAVMSVGALARVNPPLRTEADVEAIIEGLRDGTIDAIVTDHAPHSEEEKLGRPLEEALSGMVGLETSLALALTMLHHCAEFTLSDIVRLMSTAPANILGLNKGGIGCGDDADIVIFNADEEWTVDPMKFRSKGRNTPYGDFVLSGKVKCTIVGGKIVYKED